MAINRTSDTTWSHLVLAGAGVLSLSYAGALAVLHERGIRFRSVSSCSAGTFIGALLCARWTSAA
jgi:predicted acylesterase/phospholipase RssA